MVTIPQIQSELSRRHEAFCKFINGISEEDFMLSTDGKWTAGQQLDHIRRAVSLLPFGLGLPKVIRIILFGSPRSSSAGYDELVARYQAVLERGGKASGIFIPAPVKFGQREKIEEAILNTITRINARLDALSESALDASCLPHPLLKTLTLREMMMFTVYHVEHHHLLAKRNLENSRQKHA
jgi:hypothetical protein